MLSKWLIPVLCWMSVSSGEPRPPPRSRLDAAAVSANASQLVRISRVLDQMLNSSRYDSNLRPGLEFKLNNLTGEREVIDDDPVAVSVNMLIKNLGPIDEEKMMYAMEIYFRQCWMDSRLKFDPEIAQQDEIKVSISILSRIWRPDTYFFNGRGSQLHELTTPNKLLRIQADGTVFFSMRLTVKAVCYMDFRKFPVDRQTCPLFIGSFAYDSHNLVYLWWEEARAGPHLHYIPDTVVNSTNKNLGVEVTAMAQFLFRQERVLFSHQHTRLGKEYRNLLSMTIPLERMIGFYVLQIYLPSYMTVAISWVSFWINREATPAPITTLLTSVTITLTGRIGLPKVSYATALDVFLLVCFFFVFSALLEYAGVNYFTKTGNVEIPRRPQASIDSAEPEATTLKNAGAQLIEEDDSQTRNRLHRRPHSQRDSNQWRPNFSNDGHVEEAAGRPTGVGGGDSCPSMFLHCLRGDRKYMLLKESRRTSGPNSESCIDR
uniref:Neur_chan_LBD domain-containing protein n=3 Tax=Macrostomum lignano TaxID=282301 RepID=A0A1I8FUK0_9PLAT